jgi:coenzyme Q-binding protein COQ10
MPLHTEQQFSPYTPQQLFDLVSDVARYPEFLPWCRAARILERKENEFLGELVISFAHLTESYVSRVTLHPSHAIDVVLVRGPFEHLTNNWKFTPGKDGGTVIDFSLDFKFRSKILEKMIGPLFSKATAKMVSAFKARADVLYGKR